VLNNGVKIKSVHISLLFKNWIEVQTDETSNYGSTLQLVQSCINWMINNWMF